MFIHVTAVPAAATKNKEDDKILLKLMSYIYLPLNFEPFDHQVKQKTIKCLFAAFLLNI